MLDSPWRHRHRPLAVAAVEEVAIGFAAAVDPDD